MELVYLWVEDYKNIKRQGFNFSPKFECSYDEKTNELTINDKEYLKNFFCENINVTAIVGENGSGKSSLLKLLIVLFFVAQYIYAKDNSKKIFLSHILRSLGNKNIFFIIQDDKKELKKISLLELNSIYNENNPHIIFDLKLKSNIKEFSYSKIKSLESIKMNFYTIFYNYMLDTLKDNDSDFWIDDIYYENAKYDIPFLIEPSKKLDSIRIDNFQKTSKYRLFEHFIKYKYPLTKNKFFVPNNFRLLFDKNYFFNKFYFLKDEYFLKKLIWDNPRMDELIHTMQNNLRDKKYDFILINNIYIFILIFKNYEIFDEKIIKDIIELIKKANGASKNRYSQILEHINDYIKTIIEEIESLILDNSYNSDIYEIKKCINYYHGMKDKKTASFIVNLIKTKNRCPIKSFESVLEIIPNWINIEFYDDNKSFVSLSSGEKQFFISLVNITYHIRNISELKNTSQNKYETVNLFLDEIELGLHPKWQKKFISELLFNLEQIDTNIKINILVSSHSPFILSDLPKENIIFLKKGKQVYPFEDKQTFGANIHTLLSHGFFMDNSLMGEFAKNKIEEIIDFLNDKKSIDNISIPENEIKKVIKTIGEDFLKEKLLDMYNKKFILEYKERKKEKIKQQIEDLKTQYNELNK